MVLVNILYMDPMVLWELDPPKKRCDFPTSVQLIHEGRSSPRSTDAKPQTLENGCHGTQGRVAMIGHGMT